MVRSIPSAMADQLNSGAAHPVMMVSLDLPGGVTRLHSGVGVLEWDGHDWIGVAGYGFVKLPPYGAGFAQQKGSLTFGGLPDVVDAMLAMEVNGRWAEVYFGCLTGRTPAPLAADPVREFSGYLDGTDSEISDGTEQGIFGLKIGPSQTSRGSPAHTLEDQQTRFSTDTAGRFVKAAVADAIARANRW